jgi:two-component system response regulator PilR (NtrC family)
MAHPKSLPAKHILVIDDEPDLRTLYELTLLREGYQVSTAGTLEDARDSLARQAFDLVITDMRLPDGMGIELLQDIRSRPLPERCIVITAYGSAENAVESLKAGAFDYLTKPVDLKQFRRAVSSAIAATANSRAELTVAATDRPVERSVERPVDRPVERSPSLLAALASTQPSDKGQQALQRIAAQSAVMRSVKDRVTKVARSMAPVMVRGESGTGKELIAKALHANSHRSDGPWVAVNCGAIPENLLETEFFGVRKGAYTGATHDREGYFRAANSGTLFLDEIGDLPLAMQTKLLRAIQERCVRAVGATQEEPVDVRIISATHKDLAAEIAAGRFRQDLYYRLNVIDIHVPPLRERREDLPSLCETLLQRIALESNTAPMHLSERALQMLTQLPLQGNVRELENLLHRAVALSDGEDLDIEVPEDCIPTAGAPLAPLAPLAPAPSVAQDPPATEPAREATVAAAPPAPSDLQALLDQQERDILVRALKETNFNRTLAASRLGLNLRQIRYRIARLKIEAPATHEDSSDE